MFGLTYPIAYPAPSDMLFGYHPAYAPSYTSTLHAHHVGGVHLRTHTVLASRTRTRTTPYEGCHAQSHNGNVRIIHNTWCAYCTPQVAHCGSCTAHSRQPTHIPHTTHHMQHTLHLAHMAPSGTHPHDHTARTRHRCSAVAVFRGQVASLANSVPPSLRVTMSSDLGPFEVGQIWALHREGYSHREIAKRVTRGRDKPGPSLCAIGDAARRLGSDPTWTGCRACGSGHRKPWLFRVMRTEWISWIVCLFHRSSAPVCPNPNFPQSKRSTGSLGSLS